MNMAEYTGTNVVSRVVGKQQRKIAATKSKTVLPSLNHLAFVKQCQRHYENFVLTADALVHSIRYALHMVTDHDKLGDILEGDERPDLVKLFAKVN